MKKIRLISLILVLLLAFMLTGAALAGKIANLVAGEVIDWQVFSGGGARTSSGDIGLDATLGQNTIGASSSGPIELGAGYWYGMQPHTINLPIVVKNP